jgi:hypothetical protein
LLLFSKRREKKQKQRKRKKMSLIDKMVEKFGVNNKEDIEIGIREAKRVWNFEKYKEEEFEKFCLENYKKEEETKDELLEKLSEILHLMTGPSQVANKIARENIDSEIKKEVEETDRVLANFNLLTRFNEDLYNYKISALIQLNFGSRYENKEIKTRRDWKIYRLGNVGESYIPFEISKRYQDIDMKNTEFLNQYLLNFSNIDFADKDIEFKNNLKLMPHWNIRDYAMSLNDDKNGLKKQRALTEVFERVIKGEIPKKFINSDEYIWKIREDKLINIKTKEEEKVEYIGVDRWEYFTKLFEITKEMDQYRKEKDYIEYRFKNVRELELERVEKLFEDILTSENVEGIVKLIEKKLNRKVESFDIYQLLNFSEEKKEEKKEEKDDEKEKEKLNQYNSLEKLNSKIYDILIKLGFTKEKAEFISKKIIVQKSRSAGHAVPISTLFDVQRLRVKFQDENFDRSNFSTFMHELGHCTEGVISSYFMDHKLLWRIPNTAFTEAIAFNFQYKTDFILDNKEKKDDDYKVLSTFWQTYNNVLQAKFEIELYKFLYSQKELNKEIIHENSIRIANELWQKYLEKYFGKNEQALLAGYTHILFCDLYLPDYPIGRVIEYQISKFLKDKNFGTEIERICKIGSIKPDSWMKEAVNEEVSANSLLDDTKNILKKLNYL